MGGKSRPHRDSIPDSPARSQSLYRQCYPAHISCEYISLFFCLFTSFSASVNALQIVFNNSSYGSTPQWENFSDFQRGQIWTGGKSRLHRDSIPDSPARSQSLHRLSYPAHHLLPYHLYNLPTLYIFLRLLQDFLVTPYSFLCRHLLDLHTCCLCGVYWPLTHPQAGFIATYFLHKRRKDKIKQKTESFIHLFIAIISYTSYYISSVL